MSVSLSSDLILNSSIIWQGSGDEVPSTVVVDRITGINSWLGILSFFTTLGSIIVMLAWSSIMARPSMEYSESGRDRITGHVLLYDLFWRASDSNVRPRTSSWRPGQACQSCFLAAAVRVGRHPRLL